MVNSSIYLNVKLKSLLLRHISCNAYLFQRFRNKFLAPKTWMYTHNEQHIYLFNKCLCLFYIRLRTDRQTHLHATFPAFLYCCMNILTGLKMHGYDIRSCLLKGFYIADGLLHHKMGIHHLACCAFN